MIRTCCLSIVVSCLFLSLGDPLTIAGDDKPQTLTDKDTGATVKLAKGAMLEVKLPMTAGTGYIWQIVKNNPEQLVLQGRSQIIPPEQKIGGGKQIQHIHLTA